MLLPQVENESQRRDLQQIHEAARRGSNLTRQLLAFGRKQVLRVTALDLNAVVLDTSQMLKRLVGENISLRINPATEVCVVEADRSGLGLSTVYGVVKQLGGDVTVASTPLQGMAFSVHLPATSKAAQTPQDTTIPELASGKSETVLLVEDDEPVRALLCSVLRRHGYQVLEAREPREALSIAARHTGPLHLVLSDVIMPEMSGPEMVTLLRSIRPEPAVLYLSGYATDALVTDGVLPKAVSFVQKPVSARQLLEAVRRVLASSEPAALEAVS